MKKIALFGVMILVVAALAVYAASENTKTDEVPEQELLPGQARVVIPVTGMTCGGCCVPVEAAVKKLDGVVAAKADYEKGNATVTYEKDRVAVKEIVNTSQWTSSRAGLSGSICVPRN